MKIVCDKQVEAAKSRRATNELGQKGLQWEIPSSVEKVKKGEDKKGQHCGNMDFVVNPLTFQMAQKNPSFKKLLAETVVQLWFLILAILTPCHGRLVILKVSPCDFLYLLGVFFCLLSRQWKKWRPKTAVGILIVFLAFQKCCTMELMDPISTNLIALVVNFNSIHFANSITSFHSFHAQTSMA